MEGAFMNKSQDPATVPGTAGRVYHATDYAAWVDGEGREHLITRDMVDSVIEQLAAGPDFSLQGRSRKAFKCSQTRPRWGE